MIQVARKMMPSRDFEVRVDGRLLGTVIPAPWRERAQLTMGSETAEITREPWFGDFLLTRGDSILARAKPYGFWRRKLGIESGGKIYSVRRKWILGSRYLLFRGEETVGEIRFAKTDGIEVDLPEDLPYEVLLLLFSLSAFLQSRLYVAGLVAFLAYLWLT